MLRPRIDMQSRSKLRRYTRPMVVSQLVMATTSTGLDANAPATFMVATVTPEP